MSKQPERALIVIDVQDEYVTGGLRIEWPNPTASLDRIGEAMDAAARLGVPIVVVRQNAPANAPLFAKGSPSWQLHDVVGRRPRDHLVEKRLPSAFAGTDLAAWLAARGIRTVTLCGYMTHNCVASTAIQALHDGLAVEVLSDATGSVPYANAAGEATAREIHHAFMVVLQSRFAAVMETGAWVEAIEGRREPRRDNIHASHLRAVEDARRRLASPTERKLASVSSKESPDAGRTPPRCAP
jgi:nicotinamidase-related amidase